MKPRNPLCLISSLFFVCASAPVIHAQKFPISIPAHVDFDGPTSFPLRHWVILGDFTEAAVLSNRVLKLGSGSLEVKSGGSTESYLKLEANSTYKISVWMKTSSGSDEVQLNVNGLAENNISVATALADWTLIERTFNTGDGQQRALIEFKNPANADHNSSWIDDLKIERVGDYTPEKPSGIKPPTPRTRVNHLGLTSQPDEKIEWLLDAKFGMFIHWGIYAGTGRSEWAQHQMKMRPEAYRTFAYPESGDAYFTANKYEPKVWAELAKASGMKYMVLTAMHHDGYALFESKAIGAFTSKQTHNRDFVKEYVEACRGAGLKVGLFKTLINWRYPGYYDWTGTDCKPNVFGYTTDMPNKESARMMKEELYAQTKELMTNYGKIDIFFWDGGWLGQQGTSAAGAPFWESGKYMDSKNEWPVNPYFQDFDKESGKALGLMGIVRKYQPDIIVNPRSGWIGDIRAEEGGARVVGPIRAEYVYEKCMTVAPGWGYTKHYENPEKVMTVDEIKEMLTDCLVRNMVFLLNVGPNRHGEIPPLAAERFRGIGKWLEKVGEAVYFTRGGPWNPKDGVYGYTYKDNKIFVYLLGDFRGNTFTLPALNEGQQAIKAYVVGENTQVTITQNTAREVTLTGFDRNDKVATILAVELNKNVME